MADPNLHVQFFSQPRPNTGEDKETKPFVHRDYVRIRFVGDAKKEVVARAEDSSIRDPESNSMLTYAERFPEHYKAFKDGQSQRLSGTQLEKLDFLSASRRKNYEAKNVYTAEALAQLDDRAIKALGTGTRAEVEAAQAYLENSNGDDRLAALEAQLSEARAQIAALSDGPKPDDASDEDVKAKIKELTGAAPRGNPSRETLDRMLSEAEAA